MVAKPSSISVVTSSLDPKGMEAMGAAPPAAANPVSKLPELVHTVSMTSEGTVLAV